MRLLCIVCLIVCAEVSAEESWPVFRGAFNSEPSPECLPVEWSPQAGVVWTVNIPGYGQSSPVVWRDRLYVTSVEGKEKSRCTILALSPVSGEVLWQRNFDASQRGANNPMMARAAPTPVVDEHGIVAFFESGDIVAMTHTGETRWQRSLSKEFGQIKNNHALGSSLAQTTESVFVLVDHTGPSYLLAIDKATGLDRWKVERKSCLSWTSPLAFEVGGQQFLVASGGGNMNCYDPKIGKSIWTIEGLYSNDIPSPVAEGNLLFVAGGNNPLRQRKDTSLTTNCCLEMVKNGDVLGYKLLWSDSKALAYHASPIIHRNHIYIITRNGILHCRDAMTGKTKYTARLDNSSWATPIAAGGLIYFFGKDGITNVIRSGGEFELVASNSLWEEGAYRVRKEDAQKNPQDQVDLPPASPEMTTQMEAVLDEAIGDVVYSVAAMNGAFYVRTGNRLFCIRKTAIRS